MKNKNIIITGITGQDGAFLSKNFIEQGFSVVGLYRDKKNNINRFSNIKSLGLTDSLSLEKINLLSKLEIIKIIKKYKPIAIYHLASQSSVEKSLIEKDLTIRSNVLSSLNLIDSILEMGTDCKFIFPSSATIFEGYSNITVNENTVPAPISEYAKSKHIVQEYLKENLNSSAHITPILFSHESEFRQQEYFSQKVISFLVDYKYKKITKPLTLGNLKLKRDIGYAGEYMQIMTKFIESSKHNKYIISSNKLTRLKDFCEAVMNELEISFEVDYQKDKLVFIDVLTGQPIINSDEKIHRKIDLNGIKGDNSLIKNSYGWEPKKDINFIIQKMIKFKLKNY